MMKVTKMFEFEACHKLDGYADGAKNTCGNLHGHSYKLEVTIMGFVDTKTGMVEDFKELSSIVKENVISKFDHAYLNEDIEAFKSIRPTAENMAMWIWDALQDKLYKREDKIIKYGLHKIKLYETSNSFVEIESGQWSIPWK